MSDDPSSAESSADAYLTRFREVLADAEALAERVKAATVILDDLNQRQTEVDPLLKAAQEAATKFEGLRSTAITESQAITINAEAATAGLSAIEDLRAKAQVERDGAAKAKGEALQALDAAKAQADSAKQENSSAVENAANIVQARIQADAELTATKEARGRVDTHELSAKKSDAALEGLATVAQENEARVKGYEDELQDLLKAARESTSALIDKIRGLLPEATSTGLAAAFEARKSAVASAQQGWKMVFYFSLLLLVVVALAFAGLLPGFGLPQGADWHDLGLQLVRRLPLVVAPFWLALFSSRQLKTYLRLEEDYAHKVTMSNSFEGYKRELEGIEGMDTPLARHTAAVIEVLAQPPVRLYDDKHGSDTPLGTIADSAAKILDSAKGVVSGAAEAAAKLRG